MPVFATEQFQIAQQDNTNLATETYMSSKKTHHSVFQPIRSKNFWNIDVVQDIIAAVKKCS